MKRSITSNEAFCKDLCLAITSPSHAHTCSYAHEHTHARTHMCTRRTHARRHAPTHARTHACTHTHTHTHTSHTHAETHTHTHTHTHINEIQSPTNARKYLYIIIMTSSTAVYAHYIIQRHERTQRRIVMNVKYNIE